MAHKRGNLKCYRLSRPRDRSRFFVGGTQPLFLERFFLLFSRFDEAWWCPAPRLASHDPCEETCTSSCDKPCNSIERIEKSFRGQFSVSLLLIVVTNLVENVRPVYSWILFISSLAHFPFEIHDCYVNCIIGINARRYPYLRACN